MKAVISDTSPINYLVRIGEIEVLPAIFGIVLVPPAVIAELKHPQAPPELQAWIQNPPAWLHVCPPHQVLSGLDLDLGETEAISLAKEHTDSGIRNLMVDGAPSPHQSDTTLRWLIDRLRS